MKFYCKMAYKINKGSWFRLKEILKDWRIYILIYINSWQMLLGMTSFRVIKSRKKSIKIILFKSNLKS